MCLFAQGFVALECQLVLSIHGAFVKLLFLCRHLRLVYM